MILEVPRYDAISSGGESDAARFVAKQAREARQALCETYTFGHAYYEALKELVSIKEHCTFPGWDGYDAEPVRRKRGFLGSPGPCQTLRNRCPARVRPH